MLLMVVTMQAFSVTFFGNSYDGAVQTGRPSSHPRTPFGERLHAAREALGLSQAQVAEKLGITQKAYAVWERYSVALRPEQIEKVAEVLNVSVERLFSKQVSRSRGGPVGRARRVFEKVSNLSRHRQQRIISLVEDLLTVEHSNGHKQAA